MSSYDCTYLFPLACLFIFSHGGKFLVSVSAATGAPTRSWSIRRYAFSHFVEYLKKPYWYRSGTQRSGMARQRARANIVRVPQHMPEMFADKISTLSVRYSGHFCVQRDHSSVANVLVPCFSPQTTNFLNRQFPIRKYES